MSGLRCGPGWSGQERAIEALEHAAARPGHAYLLVGPAGSGVEVAARSFAAELIAPDGDERVRGLVLRGLHPDVVEFEPGGFSYLVDKDVRERILPEASRAPIESDRKVLVLFEAERLKGNQNESANAMLKTLEEPPPRTVVVLVTGAPDDLIPTIRSRCQRIDLDPVPFAALEAALVGEGCTAEMARLAGRLGGGNLARARALAGPLAALRAAFAAAPSRVDGTGATAARIADELDVVVEEAAASVAARHTEELAEFDADMERHGYSDRDAQRLRRRRRRPPTPRGAPGAHRPADRGRHRDRVGLPRRARRRPRRRSTPTSSRWSCRRAPSAPRSTRAAKLARRSSSTRRVSCGCSTCCSASPQPEAPDQRS